jgi:hypothetical protein
VVSIQPTGREPKSVDRPQARDFSNGVATTSQVVGNRQIHPPKSRQSFSIIINHSLTLRKTITQKKHKKTSWFQGVQGVHGGISHHLVLPSRNSTRNSHLAEPVQVGQGGLHVSFDQVSGIQFDVHEVLGGKIIEVWDPKSSNSMGNLAWGIEIPQNWRFEWENHLEIVYK